MSLGTSPKESKLHGGKESKCYARTGSPGVLAEYGELFLINDMTDLSATDANDPSVGLAALALIDWNDLTAYDYDIVYGVGNTNFRGVYRDDNSSVPSVGSWTQITPGGIGEFGANLETIITAPLDFIMPFHDSAVRDLQWVLFGAQCSGWMKYTNLPDTNYITWVQRARHYFTRSTSAWIAEGEIVSDPGGPLLSNVTLLTDTYTAPANTWIDVALPNTTTSSPYDPAMNTGTYGKIRFTIHDETKADWQTRTGLTIS